MPNPLSLSAGTKRVATIGAALALLGGAPFAIAQSDRSSEPTATAAAGERDPILGGVRNPSPNQSDELTRETEIIADTSSYGTRQSNKSASGGGAIYGCRSGAGGTPANNEPCIRANNLEAGRAFEFATDGLLGGAIDVGNGGDAAKPFTTNATGVATGLNADEVDGASADQIVAAARSRQGLDADQLDGRDSARYLERWALISPGGQILAQTGGFTLVNCYQANDNCYIDAGDDVRNNGIHAQIATANNPDAGTDGLLTGETSAAACFYDFVNCGPAGTDSGNGGNAGVLVVVPRNSDGSAPAADDRYPFHVYVTGSES